MEVDIILADVKVLASTDEGHRVHLVDVKMSFWRPQNRRLRPSRDILADAILGRFG